MNPAKHYCSECHEPMILGEVGMICPNGHGKIIWMMGSELKEAREANPRCAVWHRRTFTSKIKRLLGLVKR